MRYLIAETNWDMMTLAQELVTNGTLLTRTDRPEDLMHYLQIGQADLLVLAASQLDRDGIDLESLRSARSRAPIALIARDATPEQTAAWLMAGADTVIDPQSPTEEILARLQAVARRAHGLGRPVLQYGPLRIDLMHHRAHLGDVRLKLTPKVYEVLEFIALRPGRLVTRETLLTHIYGLENEPDPRVFDVYMCNLRAQLAASGGAVDIETARGAGFRFVSGDMDSAAIAA
ncbi:winged helix-turn-helix transcriptional regulator [Tropicibacter oceani]|uniref:Response regulator transcription factor n=1 Tax=Tropicibacter oceani TaxID=3058420 RepID=A0ABY8QL98_9RHOB|nr:response regulator transcription factor [Tropicibacter oceani]WGW05405.1 response regulator transcription factor [Tropicibacter oceani]